MSNGKVCSRLQCHVNAVYCFRITKSVPSEHTSKLKKNMHKHYLLWSFRLVINFIKYQFCF